MGANERTAWFFERMTLIDLVERCLLAIFATGRLRGTVHTCLGQEAVAVGVVEALDPRQDIVCSNHRGHGHFLAFGGEPRDLIAEIMGDASGVCGGIGGSQHLHFGNFYSNGILGGMGPVATGMAMAEQLKRSDAVVTLFLGDGAMAEGSVYEALNMAALWKLPILFVIEANQFAQSTPIASEIAGNLADRGGAFSIETVSADGNDVEQVFDAAKRLVAALRAGNGPAILHLRTYRLGPHSKGDDIRDPAELARHAARSPLLRMAEQLPPEQCAEIRDRVWNRVMTAVGSIDGVLVEAVRDVWSAS